MQNPILDLILKATDAQKAFQIETIQPLWSGYGEIVRYGLTGGESSEFSMNEVFTGLMAPLFTRSIPDLQPSFDEFANCLKYHSESNAT